MNSKGLYCLMVRCEGAMDNREVEKLANTGGGHDAQPGLPPVLPTLVYRCP